MKSHRAGISVALACLALACRSTPAQEPSKSASTEPLAEVAVTAPPAQIAEPAAPPPWNDAATCDSNAGTWRIRYRTDPAAIATNEPFALDVWVFAAGESTPRKDVQLSVDAGMPDHGHGMNREPRISREEGGRFRVRGMLFHMPGHWELDFDVTRAAVTERAQVGLELE